jgi:transcriptional regulator with XRE-family HTH domain
MSKSHPDTQEQPFRVYTAASVGSAIHHYRLQAGLTQVELAQRLGLTPSYLSRLENGQETEQLRRIVAILKQLGVRMTVQYADW